MDIGVRDGVFVSMENTNDIPRIPHSKNSTKRPAAGRKYKVFVYGSLLRGLGNSRLLKSSLQIGAYCTKKKYKMISLGSFPGVCKASAPENEVDKTNKYYHALQNNFRQVEGELYEVDQQTLASLDQLEGNGYFYTRELVPLVNYSTGVWMYVLNYRKNGNWIEGDSKEYDIARLNTFDRYSWREHLSSKTN